MEKNFIHVLKETRLIAIFRKVPPEHALKTAEALHKAGVRLIEVTFNTPNAELTIRSLKTEFGKDLLIGAGTVTSLAQAETAIAAGAQFMLAPNVDEVVIKAVKQAGRVMIPGAMTPTEISKAYQAGGDIIKVFPAGALGAAYFKDVLGPYDHIPLMAVGGVNLSNIRSFIKNGACAAGLGGNLVAMDHITNGDYEAICELGKRFLEQLQ